MKRLCGHLCKIELQHLFFQPTAVMPVSAVLRFCRCGVFFGLFVLPDGVCQNIVAFVGVDTHPRPMAHRRQVLLVYVRFLDQPSALISFSAFGIALCVCVCVCVCCECARVCELLCSVYIGFYMPCVRIECASMKLGMLESSMAGRSFLEQRNSAVSCPFRLFTVACCVAHYLGRLCAPASGLHSSLRR